MKEAYGNYYKIFGCACKKCGCEEKPKSVVSSVVEETLCQTASQTFTFEPADCNDCIIERTGFADAYVPYQTEFAVMSPEKSLVCGTVFASLVIPYQKSECTCKNGRGMNG